MLHNAPVPYEAHPVDIAEDLAIKNDWPNSRRNDDVISMTIDGKYYRFIVTVSTEKFAKTVQVICSSP